MIDTADSYMWRAPGNSGGESETILGEWMAARGNRDALHLATKVGALPGREGLSAENIAAAARDSLRRLGTDRIDLYYAHRDDEATAQEETSTRSTHWSARGWSARPVRRTSARSGCGRRWRSPRATG